MPVIVFGNQKGGVGKTMTAVSLAVTIASQGKSVCFMDADEQESASKLLEARNEFNDEQIKAGKDPVPHIKSEIKKASAKIARDIRENEARYDYVIVDTAGSANDAFKSAVATADIVYLPFTPCKVDMDQLLPTIKVIVETESYIRDSPGNEDYMIDTRLLVTRVNHHSREMMVQAREYARDFNEYVSVSNVVIKEIKRVQQAQEHGLTLIDVKDKNRSMYELLLREIDGESKPMVIRDGLKL